MAKRKITEAKNIIEICSSPEKEVQIIKQIAFNSFDDLPEEAIFKLKGDSLRHTLENVFAFIKGSVKYNVDRSSGFIEMRSPRRAWEDRTTGLNSDSILILTSAILHKLRIKHRYCMVKFHSRDHYSHCYILVPDNAIAGLGKGYYSLDVLSEKPLQEVPGITFRKIL